MPLRDPRTLFDGSYLDPAMFGDSPMIMAAPNATVPDPVIPPSYIDSLLTAQAIPVVAPLVQRNDPIRPVPNDPARPIPQGNPIGSLGSDGRTPIPDYLGEYLNQGGLVDSGAQNTGATVYPTANGSLSYTQPAPVGDGASYEPDLWQSPNRPYVAPDTRGSGYVPPTSNVPTQPASTATPTPAPTSKANPNDKPIVETQGFLPAPQPAPLTLEQKRAQFLNQASQGFGYNYGRNLIPDNSLDDTINSILGEQKGQAQTYLDRGKARGIYNDVGYNAGQNKINTQSQAGGSQLASLGTDVLNKYRTQANKVRDDAYGSISGLMDGQDFSLDPYFGEGNAIKNTEQRNAPGDLRTALGGQNFFDFQGLTNAAGQAQGALNLRDADVATALAARKEREAQGRGLGSTGAF